MVYGDAVMNKGELGKILYVEDDPDIQLVAKMALETIGRFSLSVCSSGQEAIDNAVGFAPDLILLDVMMPGMNGPATLTNLRAIDILHATPVIFMTANVMPVDVAHYKSLGAVDVISKPFDAVTLAQTVQEIWDRCHGR